MNQELDTALLRASNAQDIESLVALARQEGSSADAMERGLLGLACYKIVYVSSCALVLTCYINSSTHHPEQAT